MSNNQAAWAFGRIFEALARPPITDADKEYARAFFDIAMSFDFGPSDMEADEACLALGLAVMGEDPDYPGEDTELYPCHNGYEAAKAAQAKMEAVAPGNTVQELDQDLQEIQQLIDETRGFQRYHPVFVAMVGSMAAAGLSQNYNADEAIDATGHICARAATVPAHLIDSRQPKKTMQQARDFLWWMQGGEMPSWLPKEFHHEVMRAEPPEACGNAD